MTGTLGKYKFNEILSIKYIDAKPNWPKLEHLDNDVHLNDLIRLNAEKQPEKISH